MIDKKDFIELSQQLGLSDDSLVSEAQIIAALHQRMAYLILYNTDQLFSMLYRLDISEKKIKLAMQQDGDIAHHLAVLIFERQIEKIISRKNNRPQPPEKDLEW